MPVKLIGTLLLAVIVAVLTGFNLSNTCTIWCFHEFTDIPVFGALGGAFLLGVFVTLPFTFRKHRSEPKVKKQHKNVKHSAETATTEISEASGEEQ